LPEARGKGEAIRQGAAFPLRKKASNSLSHNSLWRAANGNFCASGAHVPNVRSAPVLEITIFASPKRILEQTVRHALMRLRSDIFVAALTRRVFSQGGFAAIEQRGADQAGAIFVRLRYRDGREDLYGPAPQMMIEEDGERRFEKRLSLAERDEVEAAIARERRFDSDLWLVEIETEALGDLLTVIETG
jgi:hypothetical protein